MNKKLLIPIFFASFLFTLVTTVQQNTQTLTNAQSSGIYFGVWTDNLPSFEASAGKAVSLVMLLHSWNQGNFPYNSMNSIRSHGSIPVLSWQSYAPENAVETSWKRISEGSMDGYIRQWAYDSKSWGHPYFLRFDWEMNGYWDPYSSQAEYYVPMWKHVRDIFRQEGATNVTWVWCPNIDGPSTRPLEQVFPGNDQVDWVCMDGYNFGTSQSWSSWSSFSSLFAPTYNHLLKLAPGKPIMIGEISSSEVGGSKPEWIRQMFSDLPSKFPNVKAFIWFNINKETDWRIESSEESKRAFREGINSSYFASNNYASLSSSPISYSGGLSSSGAQAFTPTPKLSATPRPTKTPTVSITPSITETEEPQVSIVPEQIINGETTSTSNKKYAVLLFVLITFGLIAVTYLKIKIRHTGKTKKKKKTK